VNNDSSKPKRRRRQTINGILGLGLDNEDGHKRVTSGEQFLLVGGSDETHGRMTEMMLKTFEELKRRNKLLQHCEPQEIADILAKSRPR
jgi:hypothetical protein